MDIIMALLSGAIMLYLASVMVPFVFDLRAMFTRHKSFQMKAYIQVHNEPDGEEPEYCPGYVIATCWSNTPWEVEFVAHTADRVFTVVMHRDDLREAVKKGKWGDARLHVRLSRILGDDERNLPVGRAQLTFLVMESSEDGSAGFDFSVPYVKLRNLVRYWDMHEKDYERQMEDQIERSMSEILQGNE